MRRWTRSTEAVRRGRSVGEAGDEDAVGQRRTCLVSGSSSYRSGSGRLLKYTVHHESRIQLFPAVPKVNWTATRLEDVGELKWGSRGCGSVGVKRCV